MSLPPRDRDRLGRLASTAYGDVPVPAGTGTPPYDALPGVAIADVEGPVRLIVGQWWCVDTHRQQWEDGCVIRDVRRFSTLIQAASCASCLPAAGASIPLRPEPMHIYGNMNRATPCRGAVRALALALLGAGMWTLSPPSAWALKLPSLLTDDELKLVLPTGMSLEDFKRSLQESAPSALATPPSSSPPVAKPGPGSVAEAPSGSGHKDNPSPPVVGVGPGMAESSGGHNPGVGGGTHENGLPGIGKVGGSAPGPDTSTGSGPDAGMASGAGSTSPGASGGAGKDAMPPSEGERPDSGMSDSGRGGESSAGGLNPDGAGKPPREEGEPGSKSPADGGQDGPPPPRDGGDADPQPPRDDGNGEQQPPKGGGDEGQRPPPAAGNGGNGGNGNAQLPERGDDAGPKPPEGEGGDEGPQPPQGGGEQDAPEVPPVAPAPPAGNGVYDPGTHTLTTPASAAVSLASSSHGVRGPIRRPQPASGATRPCACSTRSSRPATDLARRWPCPPPRWPSASACACPARTPRRRPAARAERPAVELLAARPAAARQAAPQVALAAALRVGRRVALRAGRTWPEAPAIYRGLCDTPASPCPDPVRRAAWTRAPPIFRDPHGFRPASCQARADCSFAPPEPATCRGPRSALPRFFRPPCQARRGCALRHPAPANCRGPAAGSR
ncbi:hypothetical protein L561_2565 [Bordetella pertussis STO1-CHOC-0019]|nr:hypothetical protein L561_2565 [Bordetella pertussis STO1-CHOC-0019]